MKVERISENVMKIDDIEFVYAGRITQYIFKEHRKIGKFDFDINYEYHEGVGTVNERFVVRWVCRLLSDEERKYHRYIIDALGGVDGDLDFDSFHTFYLSENSIKDMNDLRNAVYKGIEKGINYKISQVELLLAKDNRRALKAKKEYYSVDRW
jgi:hypothetical protein